MAEGASVGTPPPTPVDFTNQFNLGSASVLLTLVAGFAALARQNRTIRRENEADAKSRNDDMKNEITTTINRMEQAAKEATQAMDVRVSTLEKECASNRVLTADFMPKQQIEDRDNHIRGNLDQKIQILVSRADRQADQIKAIEVEQGRQAERQAGILTGMGDLKQLVEKGFDKINGALDRMRETPGTHP